MNVKRAKKVIVSMLLVGMLAISMALVASAGIAKKQTARSTQCGNGVVDWAFYSEGDQRYSKIDTFYWVYANGFSGCTVVSKRAARSSMDPNKWVQGYITAKYGSTTYLNDALIVSHYFDVTKGDIVLM